MVHAITGNTVEASLCLAQMRCIVEADWARRRGRRGRTAAATEGTSHASLVVMEALDAYLAASRVSKPLEQMLYYYWVTILKQRNGHNSIVRNRIIRRGQS